MCDHLILIPDSQHELIDEQHRKDLDEEYQFYEQVPPILCTVDYIGLCIQHIIMLVPVLS